MIKFGLGFVVGALLMAFIGSTHPKATQNALRQGADGISNAVGAGAASARNIADQQLPASDMVKH